MRSYQSFDLIQLPRLSAEEALALGRALLSGAKAGGKLPPGVAAAGKRLGRACDQLGRELLRRRSVEDEGNASAARGADQWIDTVWGALRGFLVAWGKLEGLPQAERAKAVSLRLFPDGLSFLTKPFAAEWADSETRLAQIDGEGLGAEIEALGGAPFLITLREAHRAYGEALHITTARPAATTTADVRGAFDQTMGALRDYVVQVAASRQYDDAPSNELADRLLGPMTRWSSTGRSRKADGPPVPPPSGDEGEAGDEGEEPSTLPPV
ncbi:MAG: hypothetical protein MUF34_19165 [Polyangiaceae bacterium]|jgi:hypothetical protein|nr:hypothetical protein [Polyangiaceae bacterium]